MSDSDDSVCFGPYTINEAKQDLKKIVPKTINYRHSSISRFHHYDVSTDSTTSDSNAPEIDSFIKEFEEVTAISSNPSEYLTATNSRNTSELSFNSDFLNQLSKAINDPIADLSYRTALDKTCQSKNNVSKARADESIIILSDDSILDDGEIEDIGNNLVVEPEKNYQICKLSHSIACDEKKKQKKPELSLKTFDVSLELPDVITSNSLSENNGDNLYTFNEISDESILNDSNIDDNDIFQLGVKKGNLSRELSDSINDEEKSKHVKMNDNFDPSLEIPNIVITNEPRSVETKDDSCSFNDTLEEINRFLEHGGADYDMPEISRHKIHSAEKPKKPSIEVYGSHTTGKLRKNYMASKIRPPAVSAKTLFNNTFKVPKKVVKTTTTPLKTRNIHLKNVVSPVGLYIKQSTTYVPMVKANSIQSKHIKKPASITPVKENSESNPDESFVLPPVIYKSAKSKLVSEDYKVKLPENINRLLPSQDVIKHEGRIQMNAHDQSIERRLGESDFSIDVSQSDVSILTQRQPFDFKRV